MLFTVYNTVYGVLWPFRTHLSLLLHTQPFVFVQACGASAVSGFQRCWIVLGLCDSSLGYDPGTVLITGTMNVLRTLSLSILEPRNGTAVMRLTIVICAVNLLHIPWWCDLTDIVVEYLQDEAQEYAQEDKLKGLVSQYSEFINFPIYLWTTEEANATLNFIAEITACSQQTD